MEILANQQNIILNKSIKLLECHTVPKSSAYYDYQKLIDSNGITRELYQFKDTLGKIIKEVENVISGNNLKEVKVTAYETRKDADIKRLFVKDTKTGKITYTKEESFPMEQGTMSYIEKVEQGKADEHKIKFLSEAGVEKEILYKTEWDGKKPKIKYKNIEGKLPKYGLEYLPLVVSEGSTKRINHIAQVQINTQKINKLANLPYVVPFEQLNPRFTYKEAKNGKGLFRKGCCFFDKVEINGALKQNTGLLTTISHEYQHYADKIGLCKILNKQNTSYIINHFMAKIGLFDYKHYTYKQKRKTLARLNFMKSGIILPFTKKDKEYRNLYNDLIKYGKYIEGDKNYKKYRNHPLEVRAFDKANEEIGKFYNLILFIKDFMLAH